MEIKIETKITIKIGNHSLELTKQEAANLYEHLKKALSVKTETVYTPLTTPRYPWHPPFVIGGTSPRYNYGLNGCQNTSDASKFLDYVKTVVLNK